GGRYRHPWGWGFPDLANGQAARPGPESPASRDAVSVPNKLRMLSASRARPTYRGRMFEPENRLPLFLNMLAAEAVRVAPEDVSRPKEEGRHDGRPRGRNGGETRSGVRP